MGGITYKKILYGELFFVQILLLTVDEKERNNGYGTNLMRYVMSSYNKIAVYSDYGAISFYQKLGFKANILLFNEIKDVLSTEINCIFLCYGFD